MQRCVVFFLLWALAFGTSALPARAWQTVCNAPIPVTMFDSVDSGSAYPGMRFRFRLTQTSNLNGHVVPVDTIGFGFVRAVTGASNRNRDGSLVLEPREIVYKNLHIQVMADPLEASLFSPSQTAADRASGYLPIPGIVRTAVNEVRNGRNITIGPGFNFHVIALGDPRTTAPCRKVGR